MITTNINYPEVLPAGLREGHTSRSVSPFVRTAMSTGRARQRRAFTSVPTENQFRFIFTSGQGAAFEAWFRDQLKDGAEWFNMPRKTPYGYQILVARFMDMYEGPDLFGPDRWLYSATIEFFERPIAPYPWGLFPEYLAEANIIDMAMNQEWPEA